MDHGVHAAALRSAWGGKLLVGVDPYEHYYGHRDDGSRVEQAQKSLLATGKPSLLILDTSVNAVDHLAIRNACIGDGGLDFVYIDGDHAAPGVDIDAWWPLLRSGGFLCGHDWVADGWRHFGDGPQVAYPRADMLTRPGWACFVRAAVDRAFGSKHLSVTSPDADGGWQSWLVVKE